MTIFTTNSTGQTPVKNQTFTVQGGLGGGCAGYQPVGRIINVYATNGTKNLSLGSTTTVSYGGWNKTIALPSVGTWWVYATFSGASGASPVAATTSGRMEFKVLPSASTPVPKQPTDLVLGAYNTTPVKNQPDEIVVRLLNGSAALANETVNVSYAYKVHLWDGWGASHVLASGKTASNGFFLPGWNNPATGYYRFLVTYAGSFNTTTQKGYDASTSNYGYITVS
jgi:hypothetical protein